MTNSTKGTLVGLGIAGSVLMFALIGLYFSLKDLKEIDYSPPPGYECHDNILTPMRELKFKTIAASNGQWCGLTEDRGVICWKARYCENKEKK